MSGIYVNILKQLSLRVGGVDKSVVNGMSAGFARTVTLTRFAIVTVEIDFDFAFGDFDGSNEVGEAVCSIDGALLRNSSGKDQMVQFVGKGKFNIFLGRSPCSLRFWQQAPTQLRSVQEEGR